MADAPPDRKTLTIRVPVELRDRIDAVRAANTPREEWIREAIEMRLGGQMRMSLPAARHVGARRPLGEVKQRGDKK